MEIEIKLGPVQPALALEIFHDIARLPGDDPARQIAMRTTYYDTPGGDFALARQTLRLRRENEVSLCTFKTAPEGLSRLELECPAETIEEGAAGLLLQPDLPEKARAALSGDAFVPTCGAAFTRHTRRCAPEGLTVELCADVGQLFAGDKQEHLCELELELVSGRPEDLERLADALTEAYGIGRCALSKQQRANALRGAL